MPTITSCPCCGVKLQIEAVGRPRPVERPQGNGHGNQRQPMTMERARQFTFWFGLHNGQRVDQVAGTAKGRQYLEWIKNEWEDGSVKRAVSYFLDHEHERQPVPTQGDFSEFGEG
jgi:hypothetical protein